MAYALGPDGRGQFAAVMQPLTVAGAFATIGIPGAVTYFVARRKSAPQVVQRVALLSAVAPAALVFAFMCWYATRVAVEQELPIALLVGAWSLIFVSAAVQIRRGFLTGTANWRRLDTERLSFAVLRFVAVAVPALLGVALAGVYVVGALVAFIVAAVLIWLPVAVPEDNTQSLPFGQFAIYSLTASIGTISAVANNRLDQVLMPVQTASAQLGYYAIAVTVAEVPLVLATLASRNAVQQASAGRSLSEIVKDVSFFLIGAITLAVVLAFAAPTAVPLFFGADFAPSVVPTQILCLSTIAAALVSVIVAVVSGRGRPGLSSLIALSGLVLTVVLFVAGWGTVGASEASFISLASQMVCLVVGVCCLTIATTRGRTTPSQTGDHDG